ASRPSTKPSPPSTRPSDAMGRRSSAFVVRTRGGRAVLPSPWIIAAFWIVAIVSGLRPSPAIEPPERERDYSAIVTLDVRYGSLADVAAALPNVRFTPESGPRSDLDLRRPLRALAQRFLTQTGSPSPIA